MALVAKFSILDVFSGPGYASVTSETSLFNPFVPSASFLYPQKTSGNLTVFWCFQGVEKGALETNGLKDIQMN